MNRGWYYAAATLLCALLTWFVGFGPVRLIGAWAMLACLYVAAGYFLKRGELFLKGRHGRVPPWLKFLLGPVVVFTHLYHWMMRRSDPAPPLQEIEPGLYLGRRLLPGDEALLEREKITAILDLTVEFDGLPERFRASVPHYLNIPVYDHHVPRRSQMARALRWIDECRRRREAVLIHCALGQGRSVLFLLAYLLWKQRDSEIDFHLQKIRAIRSTVKPNARQRRFLEKYRDEMTQRLRRRAALIINTDAGRGDGAFQDARTQRIEAVLGPYLELETYAVEPGEPLEGVIREVLKQVPEQILVYGGDGTVSAVASHLIATGIPLGILPGGTANALADCLYGGGEEDDLFEESMRRILEGRTMALDAGISNGKPFFLLLGIGWEAGMVREASKEMKARWGALAYFFGGFEQLRELNDFSVQLEVDGAHHEFRATNLIVANALPQFSLFAQGLSGEVEMGDGWLHVTAVVGVENRMAGAQVVADLVQAGWGAKAESPHLRNFRGKQVRIRTDPMQGFVRDGEVEPEESLEIHVKEQALQVFA